MLLEGQRGHFSQLKKLLGCGYQSYFSDRDNSCFITNDITDRKQIKSLTLIRVCTEVGGCVNNEGNEKQALVTIVHAQI